MSELRGGERFRFEHGGKTYLVDAAGWCHEVVHETERMIETRSWGPGVLADHCARLAARVAELEAEKAKQAALADEWRKRAADLASENAKLRACVKAADAMRQVPSSYDTRNAYDAARADLEKP